MMIYKLTKYILILILYLFLCGNIIAQNKNLNNYEFVISGLKDSIKHHYKLKNLPVIEILESEQYTDIMLSLNNGNYSLPELQLTNLHIMFTYTPYRKVPFFKKYWQRSCFIKAWFSYKGNKELISWVFKDNIRVKPKKMENPNWHWTIGKINNEDAFVRPSWIEPILAIAATMGIVYSIFYIRS